MRRVALALILFASPLLRAQQNPLPTPAADSNPLWELGIGGGAAYVPDYPGSDQSRLWAIPFPWGIYRGEILHSDRRGGTRARFIRGAGYELNVSAAGGLPSQSDHNRARAGMPNLEWLGEVGPRLTLDLMTYKKGSLLRLGLPFRAALSTNFKHFKDRGFSIAPELLYDDPNFFGTNFDAFVLITSTIIDRRYASYFYGVQPNESTSARPSYQARGGYLMSDINFGVMLPLPLPQIRFYTFASVQFLQGSANDQSPLMRARQNFSLSAVLIWAFAQSATKVAIED